MSDEEYWEQWCGSTVPPVERIKRHAKIRYVEGIRWITYPDEINGAKVIVDMPVNAPTKTCDQGRHDHLPAPPRRTARRRRSSQGVSAWVPLAVWLFLSPRSVPGGTSVLTTTLGPRADQFVTELVTRGPFFFHFRCPRPDPGARRIGHLRWPKSVAPHLLSRQRGAHSKRAGTRPLNPRPHRSSPCRVTVFGPNASSPQGVRAGERGPKTRPCPRRPLRG